MSTIELTEKEAAVFADRVEGLEDAKTAVQTPMTDNLISIADAAANGIERVRLPHWANPLDHLKIDIVDGKPGPWLHLFAPFNKECNGRDPVDFLWIAGPMKTDVNVAEFFPYGGPLPESNEYRAAQAQFDR